MRNATRIVAMWLGVIAGLAGLEHGYFEILQGNTNPESLVIESIGAPCVPEVAWNSCEPAMTIIPNFLITGIVAVLLSILVIWSAVRVHHSNGGVILILLSVALLLFGGGFFPPLIGIVGGAAGLKINQPVAGKKPGSILRFAGTLWPWPLVAFIIWTLGQFPFGYFFNDLLQSIMGFGVLLILVTLPLSVYAAYAHDVETAS